MQEHTKTTAVSRTKYSFRVFRVLKCDIWGFAYMSVIVFIPYISGPGKEKTTYSEGKGHKKRVEAGIPRSLGESSIIQRRKWYTCFLLPVVASSESPESGHEENPRRKKERNREQEQKIGSPTPQRYPLHKCS